MIGKRWMKSVLKAAAETRVALPWERTARVAFLQRRKLDTAKARLAGV